MLSQVCSRGYLVLFATTAGAVLLTACNLDRVSMKHGAPKELVLTDARDPQWVDPLKSGVDIRLAGENEIDLVEAVLSHRAAYHRHLEQLRDYYATHGYVAKKRWADTELEALKQVQPFRYLLDAEVPAAELRAQESIPEADRLYEKGLEQMRRAGRHTPLFYRQKGMIESARTLRELITRFPSSDKIDDAAFLLGEIHADYLTDQEAIAIRWFERARQWSPGTQHSALYRAAQLCDYRLRDRDRAVELYQTFLRSDQGDRGQRFTAQRRLDELTGGARAARNENP